MSVNQETNYITLNQNTSQYQDLSGIFQPLSLGTAYTTPTGFKTTISGVEKDLNEIFAAGNDLGYSVGYKLTNGTDLSQIFAKYNPPPFSLTNATYTYSDNYYVINFTNGTGSITFLDNINNVNIIMVGAGGGGAGTPSPSNTYQLYGAGGGGGGQAVLKYNVVNNSTYTASIGSGGSGNSSAAGSSGGSTIFNSLTVTGGSGGVYGTNIATFGLNTTNIGGAGGSGTNGSEVIYTGTGGAGGTGGVNPFLSGTDTYDSTTQVLNWARYGFDSFLYTNKNIIGFPSSILTYSGGGAGAASNCGGGGNGSGGVPSTSIVTTNGLVAGAGGGAANYNTTTPGNGADGICIVYFQYPQLTPYFTYSGKYNYIYDNNYCYVNFITDGSLNITSTISNAIVIVVGGGGGGGGGNSGSGSGGASPQQAGAGGGGGGAAIITSVSLSVTTYNIEVGSGGAGGNSSPYPAQNGSNGTSSAFSNILTSSGGNGGSSFVYSGGGGYGGGGTAGTSTSSGYSIYGGGNGNGGNGGDAVNQVNFYGTQGSSSEIYGLNSNQGYQLPNNNYVYFSGGGGGGASGNSSAPQGALPGNGVGGLYGYPNTFVAWPNNNNPTQIPPVNNFNGVDAVLYGAGGGGGSEGNGGNGAPGIVMLIFSVI
jgi:hypothetical protein